MSKLVNLFRIRNKVKWFLTPYFSNDLAFDVEFGLRMRAMNSSCEYIEKNMVGVPLFNESFDAVDYALDKISFKGIICEFGVFKGKSVNYIARKSAQEVHAFDSFDGLPETWLSYYKKGHFAVKKMPVFEKNVVVHKGLFDDTLPQFVIENDENISFLHIDCDLYSSTKSVFNLLNKKIVEGTVIIFDEYFNYPFWEHHEFKAFQEFVSEHGLEYEYLCYSSRKFGSKVAVKIIKRATIA